MVSITKRYGESCTASATPANGYEFTNWTEGGSQVSASPQYTFTVERSRNLTANFGSAAPSRYIDYTATSGPVSGNWVINYTDTSRNTYDNTTHQGRLYLTSNAPLGGGPSTVYTPFYNRTDLTRVDLHKSALTAIGANTFEGCSSLSTVILKNNVDQEYVTLTSIGDSAFSECSNFSGWTTYLDTLSSLSYLGDSAFYNCGGGNNGFDIDLHEATSLTEIPSYCFALDTSGGTCSIALPETIQYIDSNAITCIDLFMYGAPPELGKSESVTCTNLYVPSDYLSDYAEIDEYWTDTRRCSYDEIIEF